MLTRQTSSWLVSYAALLASFVAGCAADSTGSLSSAGAAGMSAASGSGSGGASGSGSGGASGSSSGGASGSGSGGASGSGGSGACTGLTATECGARAGCYGITRLLLCPGTTCPYVFDHCADNGCDPACGAGSICVRTQTLGGALIQPDDAGVCPSGTYLVPSGGTGPGFCEGNPSFACAPRPAACTGALSCDCAASACPPAHTCQNDTPSEINCLLLAP